MGLLTREIERVDLSDRAGQPLVARVERLGVHASFGRQEGGFALRAERLRPLSIEASSSTGARELSLAVSPDPWLLAALGILILWTSSVVVTLLAARLRSRSDEGR